jgi:amidohydrolase
MKADWIQTEVKRLRDEVRELRRDFHQHPELGFQEIRTSEIVENYLKRLGLETTRIARTGVVGLLSGAARGPTLLLRADMDALPIQEESDLPFRSVHDGVMHACGHDGHTAILLAAARILSGRRRSLHGNIKFVFQPNEEVSGAEPMIAEGVLEKPKVDAAAAIHLWTPLPTGVIGLDAGAATATLAVFRLTLTGKGGHTASPETAVDPIIAAANIIQTVQTIQTRETSAERPTIIMFGRIEGGTKSNIVPESVRLEGSIRYRHPETEAAGENPEQRFERIVKGISAAHRVTYDLEVELENRAVLNDPIMTRLGRSAAAEIVDAADRVIRYSSMAAEDFAEFSRRVPSVFCYVGACDSAGGPCVPHHNPRFTLDEDSLEIGVELFVRIAERYFREKNIG